MSGIHGIAVVKYNIYNEKVFKEIKQLKKDISLYVALTAGINMIRAIPNSMPLIYENLLYDMVEPYIKGPYDSERITLTSEMFGLNIAIYDMRYHEPKKFYESKRNRYIKNNNFKNISLAYWGEDSGQKYTLICSETEHSRKIDMKIMNIFSIIFGHRLLIDIHYIDPLGDMDTLATRMAESVLNDHSDE